jgi:Uma2 family endonuclease
MPRTGNAKRMTLSEYLAFEETTQVKHEFVDGFVFAMAGASNNHNLINTNLIAWLRPVARGSRCRAYVNDMKLRTPDDVIYYPDILLVCDEADLIESPYAPHLQECP